MYICPICNILCISKEEGGERNGSTQLGVGGDVLKKSDGAL